MQELVGKIAPYNLFNYLLPGCVFSLLADRFTSFTFIYENLFIAFFAYYFTGLVISRFGSLVVAPVLRSFRFIEEAPYDEFVRCSAADPKLEVLSEANNAYRTFVSVFVVLGILKIGEIALDRISASDWVAPLILCVILSILFLAAYRKQTSYIKKRIESIRKEESDLDEE